MVTSSSCWQLSEVCEEALDDPVIEVEEVVHVEVVEVCQRTSTRCRVMVAVALSGNSRVVVMVDHCSDVVKVVR